MRENNSEGCLNEGGHQQPFFSELKRAYRWLVEKKFRLDPWEPLGAQAPQKCTEREPTALTSSTGEWSVGILEGSQFYKDKEAHWQTCYFLSQDWKPPVWRHRKSASKDHCRSHRGWQELLALSTPYLILCIRQTHTIQPSTFIRILHPITLSTHTLWIQRVLRTGETSYSS